MPNDRNTNTFWKNVATGVGVAAAGAALAYLVSELFTEEASHTGERMWPIAFQLLKTALIGAVAASVAIYIYCAQNQYDESPLREDERRRRGRHVEPSQLRKVITDKLNSGSYDCNICLDEISKHQPIVSCKQCYTINHLKCIRHHCRSSQDSGRIPDCPSCRKSIDYDLQYYCFCRSKINPRPIQGITPHCCLSNCSNRNCRLSCHPGPCEEN